MLSVDIHFVEMEIIIIITLKRTKVTEKFTNYKLEWDMTILTRLNPWKKSFGCRIIYYLLIDLFLG